jgi:hypothetical protein
VKIENKVADNAMKELPLADGSASASGRKCTKAVD